MNLTINPLGPENVDLAMRLVTERYQLQARAGLRDEDYEVDWLREYDKFRFVANGGLYAGYVGFKDRHQPVAVSLIVNAPGEGEDTGIWEWFYKSPHLRSRDAVKGMRSFPGDLARHTMEDALKRGLKHVMFYVPKRNSRLQRFMDRIGASPTEVEYRADVKDLRMEASRNGYGR